MLEKINNSENFFESEFNTANDYSLDKIWSACLRNKKLIFVSSFLYFLVTLLFLRFLKPTWQGSFSIVLAGDKGNEISNISTAINRNPIIGNLINTDFSSQLDTQVKILESPSVLNPIYKYVIEQRKLLFENVKETNFQDWKRNLKIELEQGTSVLDIKYQSNNKELIIPVLNKISNAYQKYSNKERDSALNKGLSYLNSQINFFKIKSRNSLTELDNYSKEHNILPIIYGLDESKSSDLNFAELRSVNSRFGNLSNSQVSLPGIITTKLEQQRINLRDKIQDIEYKLKEIENLWASNKDLDSISKRMIYLISDFDEENISTKLINIIQELDIELTDLRTKFKEDDISIRLALKKRNLSIESLREQSLGLLNAQLAEAKASLNKTKKPQGVLIKFKELYRIAHRNLNVLSILEDQKLAISLEKSRSKDPWELISKPTLLDYPIAPRIINSSVLALLFGSIFGLVIGIYKERKSGILYNQEDLLNLIRFPIIKIFSSLNEEYWEAYIDLLFEQYINSQKLNKIGILTLNFKEISSDQEKLISLFKNKFKRKVMFFSKPSEMDELECQFLLVQTGFINKSNIEVLSDTLKIKDLNIKGILLIKK